MHLCHKRDIHQCPHLRTQWPCPEHHPPCHLGVQNNREQENCSIRTNQPDICSRSRSCSRALVLSRSRSSRSPVSLVLVLVLDLLVLVLLVLVLSRSRSMGSRSRSRMLSFSFFSFSFSLVKVVWRLGAALLAQAPNRRQTRPLRQRRQTGAKRLRQTEEAPNRRQTRRQSEEAPNNFFPEGNACISAVLTEQPAHDMSMVLIGSRRQTGAKRLAQGVPSLTSMISRHQMFDFHRMALSAWLPDACW